MIYNTLNPLAHAVLGAVNNAAAACTKGLKENMRGKEKVPKWSTQARICSHTHISSCT